MGLTRLRADSRGTPSRVSPQYRSLLQKSPVKETIFCNWASEYHKQDNRCHTAPLVCVTWLIHIQDAAGCILCAATIWGGYFALYEQNNPPKYLGNKSEISHLNFTTPPHNFGLQHQVRKPPSKPIVSLWSCGSSFMFAKMLSNADK